MTAAELVAEELSTLAHAIARRRKAAAMSIEALSALAKVSADTVMRLENGNAGVGIGAMLRVLRALEIPIPEDAEFLNQELLPLHAIHVDNPAVDEAIEKASDEVCSILDKLFPDALPETHGINSNFRGLLADHLRAMLCGKPFKNVANRVALNPLLYDNDCLGRAYSLSEGATGYLVRVNGTKLVLDEGRFKSAQYAQDMYSSWDSAAEALKAFLATGEHPPGPVRIVGGYFLESRGVGFA